MARRPRGRSGSHREPALRRCFKAALAGGGWGRHFPDAACLGPAGSVYQISPFGSRPLRLHFLVLVPHADHRQTPPGACPAPRRGPSSLPVSPPDPCRPAFSSAVSVLRTSLPRRPTSTRRPPALNRRIFLNRSISRKYIAHCRPTALIRISASIAWGAESGLPATGNRSHGDISAQYCESTTLRPIVLRFQSPLTDEPARSRQRHGNLLVAK